MVRKILELQDDRLALNLPLEYVGKTVEILVFPVESEEKIEKQIVQHNRYNVQDKEQSSLAATEDSDEEFLEVSKDEIYGLSLDDTAQNAPSLETVQAQEKFEFPEDEEAILQKHKTEQPPQEKALSTPAVSIVQKKESSCNIPSKSSNQEEECAFGSIKILVAEDNDINQKLITTVLKSLGLQVEIAQNGLIAFQKRKSNNYDLIFMDIAMPVMDGIQATKNILQYEKENNLKHIPIVALTANALKGDRERFVSEGLDEYMTKPIKRSVIVEMIKMFIHAKPQNTSVNIPPESQVQSVKAINPPPVQQNIPSRPNVQVEQKDILVYKKSAVETNIIKSILTQSGYMVETCTTLEELEQKLQSIHFCLFVFDYEAPNLKVEQVANWIHNAQKLHNQGDIKSIMFCNLGQNIPSNQATLFSKIVKGMIGRAEFENMIKEII